MCSGGHHDELDAKLPRFRVGLAQERQRPGRGEEREPGDDNSDVRIIDRASRG